MDIRVSVIIPAYNAQDSIAESIESVLLQSYQDFKLIVIDDCSTDSTADIVRRFIKNNPKISFLSNEGRKGPSGARNTALKRSEGEYIAFLDADDIWLPNHLEKGIHFLDDHKDIDAVFFNFNITDLVTRRIMNDWFSERRFVMTLKTKIIDREFHLICENMFVALLRESFIQLQSMILRKRSCQNITFNENIMRAEDLDFVISVYRSSKAKFAYNSTITSNYRRHENSLTSNSLEKATSVLLDHIYLFNSYMDRYCDSDRVKTLLNEILYDRHINLSYCLRKQSLNFPALAHVLKSARYRIKLQQIIELLKIMVSSVRLNRRQCNTQQMELSNYSK